MKCHCGLECSIMTEPCFSCKGLGMELFFSDGEEKLGAGLCQSCHGIKGDYYYCPKHGFQGWVNTEGFELLP